MINLYLDAFIDVIVNEVVKRILNRPKKALVAFTGGSIGFTEGIKAIKDLMNDGWEIKVLLSKSAEYVLKPDNVKNLLGIDKIYLESEVTNTSNLYQDMDMIILPVLTINTASKIALCINDSMIPSIVSNAIMEGKPIVAARNACDLDDPTRKTLGMDKAPEAYKQKIRDHMELLKDYGINLVDVSQLYSVCVNTNNIFVMNKKSDTENKKVGNIQNIQNIQNRQENIGANFTKKVLSRQDIIRLANENSNIYVKPGTIVTDLAKDTARSLGVDIIYQ